MKLKYVKDYSRYIGALRSNTMKIDAVFCVDCGYENLSEFLTKFNELKEKYPKRLLL